MCCKYLYLFRKAILRNLNFLLAVYEHIIGINLSKKGMHIAFFNVIPEFNVILFPSR